MIKTIVLSVLFAIYQTEAAPAGGMDQLLQGIQAIVRQSTPSTQATSSAVVRVDVNLPGSPSPEWSTDLDISQMPKCTGNAWQVEGSQGSPFDSTVHCINDPTVRIAVSPFRCSSYQKTPNAQGIYECSQCAFGFDMNDASDSSHVIVYSQKNKPSSSIAGYFVPQTLTDKGNMASCLLVQDPNLLSLCSSVGRASNGSGPSMCQTNGAEYQFDSPVSDNGSCPAYSLQVQSNSVSCFSNQGQ